MQFANPSLLLQFSCGHRINKMAGEKIASVDFFLSASECTCVCVCVFFVCGIKSNQIEATNGRMATAKQKIKLQAARGWGGGKLEILHSHSNNAIQIGSKIKWSSASTATTAAAAAEQQ